MAELALAIPPIVASLYKVSESLKETIELVKKAPQQIKHHINEITLTKQVFLSVNSLLSSLTGIDIPADGIRLLKLELKRTRGTVRAYRRTLHKIRRGPTTGLPTVVGRFQWLLKKGDLTSLHKDLESAKFHMSLCLTMIHIQMSVAKINSGKRSQAEVSRLKEEIHMLREQLSQVQDLALENFDEQPAHQQKKNLRMSTLAQGIAQSQGIKSTSHASHETDVSDMANNSSEDEVVTLTTTASEPPIHIWDNDSVSVDLQSRLSSENNPRSSPSPKNSRAVSLRSRAARDPPDKPITMSRVSVAQGARKSRLRLASDTTRVPNLFRKPPQTRVDRLRDEYGEIIDEWTFDDDGYGEDS